jgi:mono/diheme cytochrome c family protein
MQVKVVIGTLAFMLSMIIMGFAALSEPARMERFTLAYEGRRIEQGAEVFKNNCASCHGVNGKAEACFDDATGEQIACAGIPLHTVELLCDGDSVPLRLSQREWAGTKYGYVASVVAAGRTASGMPTWGEAFGGPLRDNQVENVTLFVLNWESEELCAGPPPELYAWPELWEDHLAEFPGDAAQGEAVYLNPTYACTACHGQMDNPASAAIGPHLAEIGVIGGERVAGQSVEQYIYESIIYPSDFIAPECPSGPCPSPSSMPANLGDRISPEEMSDLVLYLSSLGR